MNPIEIKYLSENRKAKGIFSKFGYLKLPIDLNYNYNFPDKNVSFLLENVPLLVI